METDKEELTPPPPNQAQQKRIKQHNGQKESEAETERQRQRTPENDRNSQKATTRQHLPPMDSGKTRSWADIISQDATRKAVFERIREKDCQVYVDFRLGKDQADVWRHKGGRELTLKANEIVQSMEKGDCTGKPEEVMIWGAHRMGEGRYIFDVNSPVAANWLRAEGNRETFAKGLAEGAIIVLRAYPIVIKFVPVTFDVNNPDDLKEIVMKTRDNVEQVLSARWIKDPNRRGPNQKVAFLSVELKTPEAANAIIANGAYIHGKRCDAKKYRTDAMRCNKCQRYGHVTALCKAELPTCGHCAKGHWTNQCNIEATNPYCINCRISGHAARDFRCPAMEERSRIQDNRNPDRKLRFYPTVDAWTHEMLPEYASNETRHEVNGELIYSRQNYL